MRKEHNKRARRGERRYRKKDKDEFVKGKGYVGRGRNAGGQDRSRAAGYRSIRQA